MSYWLVTAPAVQGSKDVAFKDHTNAIGFCENKQLNVPNLKVGTLDSLLQLSDELVRIDQYCEGVVQKISRDLKEQVKSDEELLVNKTPVEKYLQNFTWDDAKYSVNSPLKDLVDYIHENVSKLDSTVKNQITDYNGVKSSISAIERKEQNNLMSKTLVGIVKEEHNTESENLCTMFVVIPKFSYKDFLSTYETLTTFVVPRSANLIAEDENFGLYGVVLFRRVVDEFGNKIREKKWTVRDFSFDSGAEADSKQERSHLESEKDRLWGVLVRHCKTAYSEVFAHWVHLKAIRVFVESVLRYGLPANFVTILMKPGKSEKKARDALKKLYGHLASGMAAGGAEADDPTMGEFYPYVFVPLKLSA